MKCSGGIICNYQLFEMGWDLVVKSFGGSVWDFKLYSGFYSSPKEVKLGEI